MAKKDAAATTAESKTTKSSGKAATKKAAPKKEAAAKKETKAPKEKKVKEKKVRTNAEGKPLNTGVSEYLRTLMIPKEGTVCAVTFGEANKQVKEKFGRALYPSEFDRNFDKLKKEGKLTEKQPARVKAPVKDEAAGKKTEKKTAEKKAAAKKTAGKKKTTDPGDAETVTSGDVGKVEDVLGDVEAAHQG